VNQDVTRILEAAIEVFDEKGLHFTMDELASRLGMSKRTLYELVSGKERIVELLVEKTFASIKEQEKAILADGSLDTAQKFRRILALMPSFGVRIDYRKVHEIRRYFPDQYENIRNHLDSDWEITLDLVEAGVAEGRFAPVNAAVLKELLYSTMETMLNDKFLAQNNLSYEDALCQILDIVFDGLLRRTE